MSNTLATGNVSSHLSCVAGRAIISARGHHLIVDSPLPLGGPNEALNPVDLLLSALATCATFVCGDPVDPRMQAFRVNLVMSGPDEAQAQVLVEAFQKRCPIYTTLSQPAPIATAVPLVVNA